MNSKSDYRVFDTAFVAYLLSIAAVVGFALVVYLLAASSTMQSGSRVGKVACAAVLDSDGRGDGSDGYRCDRHRQQRIGQAVLLGLPSTLLGSAAISLACTRLRR